MFLVAPGGEFWLDRYRVAVSPITAICWWGSITCSRIWDLPLQYVKAGAALLAAALVLARKRRWAVACAVVLVFASRCRRW